MLSKWSGESNFKLSLSLHGIFQHSIPAYRTKNWNIAFTNCWRKHTRLDVKASLPLTTSEHFGQMRRSVIDIIFYVEIFAMRLIFLSINIFVRFGGRVFRQVIGIPMGTNSAPLLADLFLHTYEYEFIIKTMKGDITRALQFSKTFRYIDDLLCVINDNFKNHIGEIYPSELILKNTTATPSETSLRWYYHKHLRGKWDCKSQRLRQKGRLQLQECELSIPGQ